MRDITFKDRFSKLGLYLCTIILVSPILFGFSSTSLAGSLSDRLEQFPEWTSKPSVKLAKGDLEYPEWMAGTWNVTSTLTEQFAPLAPDIVTPGFEDNRDYINKAIAFPVRFGTQYYTPTKTLSAFKSSKPVVVADRAFNGTKIAEAYLGKDNVYSVKIDPDNPNRQITFLAGDRKLFSKITGRGREIPKSDRFLNSADAPKSLLGETPQRRLRSSSPTTGDATASRTALHRFIATEVTQQLFRSPERLYLNEVETTSSYRLLDSDNISAEQITAIYLSPQDPDYFTAGDRPVALYHYHLDLTKQ